MSLSQFLTKILNIFFVLLCKQEGKQKIFRIIFAIDNDAVFIEKILLYPVCTFT